MNRLVCFVLAFFATFSLTFGQGASDYIKWKTSVEQDGKGNAVLVIKATVDKEWNGYSIVPAAPDEGPLPTEFTFEPSKNYSLKGKLTESGMKKVYDEMFELDVMKFSPNATFKQPIEINSTEDFVIKGRVSFMICKDMSGCIPGEANIDFFVSGVTAMQPENRTPSDQAEAIVLEPTNDDQTQDIEVQDIIEWSYELQQADKSGRYNLFLYPTLAEGWSVAVQPLEDIFLVKNEQGINFGTFALNQGQMNESKGIWTNADFRSSVVYSGDAEPAIQLQATIILTDGARSIVEKAQLVINFANAKLITDGTCEPKIFDGKESKDKFSYWELMIEAFLWGIASLLTPCVFPMIPMTVSFFMKDSSDPEAKKSGKKQAVFYGLSIIGIYTLIGTIVAITLGAAFANWLATHWIPNVLFFLVFMFFAASFLGMFEIRLPSWMINKADQKADKGGIVGTFFMALTLVLVSFSCTGPIVGIILIKASQGAVIEPMLGMFAFSLAFALPFTLFAIFPAWLKNLPQSGGWLNTVKVVLGFIEIALGLKFLSVADQTYHWGILDREVYIALWIVIFGLLAMYLLGKLKFSHDSDLPYIKVPRLFLAMSILAFVVYLVPGLWGHPLKALSGYLPPMSTHDFDLIGEIRGTDEYICGDEPIYGDMLHLPHGIAGYYDFEQAMACARAQDKPLFIDFTGHGCVNCREMEAKVWSDPTVLKMLKEKFVVVALYADDKTILPEEKWVKSNVDGKIKKTIGDINLDFQICNFGESAQPLYATLDKDENLLQRPISYTDLETFKSFLEESLVEFKKSKRGESPI
jgi:cytochrome c biogenesis protein CcdA/thioredoxin-related protein